MAQDKHSTTSSSEHTLNQEHHLNDDHGVEHAGEKHGGHGTEGDHGSLSHEITIFAEPLFQVGNFTVTNSLLNAWISVFILIVFTIFLRNKMKLIPKGFQNFFEVILESGLSLSDSVTGDRKKSVKVFPFVMTLFLFILVNNYLGLVPGIGSIGLVAMHDGHAAFIPYFRGATADLNTTLALSIMSVLLANLFGILTIGIAKYFNKFINVTAILIPFKTLFANIKKEGLLKSLVNFLLDIFVGVIQFAVGLIEIIGEIAKVASLSFRLFGNVFAGEVLLASIAAIFAFLVPIPFYFLEVIVGVVQALVFSILTLVYFSIASMEHDH